MSSPSPSSAPPTAAPVRQRSTATYFFLRGVAITLPPVLTLLILLWAANGFNTYVIQPINTVVRYGLANWKNDIRARDQLEVPPPNFPSLPEWKRNYLVTPLLRENLGEYRTTSDILVLMLSDDWNREVYVPMGRGTASGQYVPLADYDFVFKELRPQPPPTTPIGLYMEIASVRSIGSWWLLSAASLSIPIVGMDFLGRFVP